MYFLIVQGPPRLYSDKTCTNIAEQGLRVENKEAPVHFLNEIHSLMGEVHLERLLLPFKIVCTEVAILSQALTMMIQT